MNSALKPVLPQPGVAQPGGQASPAKANVANVNHAVGHPQGAQNSLHHASNNLVGQNLTHHAPAPPPVVPLGHVAPPMAPVSANMAQMAQNVSHRGNLSHVTQNSVGPSNLAASPSKGGNPNTPLSLVQDKALALTRTPEKNEPDSAGHANGTIDSPKSGTNAPSTLKPQNPELNKDKQDIAKTSPSTPKPPEIQSSLPSTPQKNEPSNSTGPTEAPEQPKVATASEPLEKSPSKPTDLKPATAADVAPSQSDTKPVPESANDSSIQEKVPTPVKPDSPSADIVKSQSSDVEEKKDEPKPEQKPQQNDDNKKEEVKLEKSESTKKEEESTVEKSDKVEKLEEKVDDKKNDVKTAKAETKPKSTIKLATVTTPMRKRRQASPSRSSDGVSSSKKSVGDGDSTPDTRTKRNRTKVQLYQSPTPELAMATKLSASAGRSTSTKPSDDKLIVIYKNEYLAVRNAEGGFYVCQAVQNVYRTTRKVKIRWLSQDKVADPSGETYRPDFYDTTDMECVLTTLSLTRGAGGTQLLKATEAARARSILQRALQAEATGERAQHNVTEEHPDGLDLSLYKDESQLEKKSRKRNSSKSSPRTKPDSTDDGEVSATPVKRARTTPKRSSKSARKTKTQTPNKQQNNKRKSAGTTPPVANTSKVGIVQRIYRNTATAVSEKTKSKTTPKRTPAKQKESPVATPTRKARRAAKEVKASPIVPVPSTSTGKTSRTPRKPPANK